MSKDISINSFKGINNVTPHIDLPVAGSTAWLLKGTNIDITNSGAISKRKGLIKILDGNFRNLFSSPIGLFCLKDGSICRIEGTSIKELYKDVKDNTLSWAYLPDNRVVFIGRSIFGYIRDDKVSIIWGGTSINPVGLDSNSKMLEFFNGRLYWVKDNNIFYSELFRFLDSSTYNFIQLPEEITMLRPLEKSIWISTTKKIYCLLGNAPENFVFREKLQIPVIPDTDVVVSGNDMVSRLQYKFQGALGGGKTLFFLTKEGLFCTNSAEDDLLSLTGSFYKPDTEVGFGAVVFSNDTGTKYLALTA